MTNPKECVESLIERMQEEVTSPSDGDVINIVMNDWYSDFKGDRLSHSEIATCVEEMKELKFGFTTYQGDYEDELEVTITAVRTRIISKDNGDMVYRYSLNVEDSRDFDEQRAYYDSITYTDLI